VIFKTFLAYSWEYSQKIFYKMLIFYYITEVARPVVDHVIYVIFDLVVGESIDVISKLGLKNYGNSKLNISIKKILKKC